MIIPQPPAEVGQSFGYDPANPNKLHLSAWEVVPFQLCPTSSAAQKNKRPKRPL